QRVSREPLAPNPPPAECSAACPTGDEFKRETDDRRAGSPAIKAAFGGILLLARVDVRGVRQRAVHRALAETPLVGDAELSEAREQGLLRGQTCGRDRTGLRRDESFATIAAGILMGRVIARAPVGHVDAP